MNLEEHNGSTVFKRQSEYKPGRNWRNFLIGRPLSTADAPHQTIGKLLGISGLLIGCNVICGLRPPGNADDPGCGWCGVFWDYHSTGIGHLWTY